MNDKSKNEGFTILELITSIFIFSLLMTIVGGVFVNSLNLQRRAFRIQQIQDNLGVILESMAKEIRVSRIISTNTSCPASSASSLEFQRQDVNSGNSIDVVFNMVSGQLIRTENGSSAVINSDSIKFTKLSFCISGADDRDTLQPRVTVIADVQSASDPNISMPIETTISTRTLQGAEFLP